MIARSVTDPKSFALNFLLFAGLQPPAFKFLLDLTLIKVQCSGTLTPPPVHFLVAMRDCLPPSDGCLDRKAFALDLWSLGCIIYLAGEPIQMNPTDRWRRFADSGDPNPLVLNHIRPLENESFEELFVDIYVLKQW